MFNIQQTNQANMGNWAMGKQWKIVFNSTNSRETTVVHFISIMWNFLNFYEMN